MAWQACGLVLVLSFAWLTPPVSLCDQVQQYNRHCLCHAGAGRSRALAAWRCCSGCLQRVVHCSAVSAPTQSVPATMMAPTDTGLHFITFTKGCVGYAARLTLTCVLLKILSLKVSTLLCAGFKPSSAVRVPSAASELQDVFRAAMRAALPKLTDEPVVVQTNNPKFGDYQLNNAMRIFAHLKGQARTPALRQAAQMYTAAPCVSACLGLQRVLARASCRPSMCCRRARPKTPARWRRRSSTSCWSSCRRTASSPWSARA